MTGSTEFKWGAATSAYQIEGARHADGKGDSIWDRFSDEGRLRDPGDVTCDHYHRWEEDLDLLARLGVDAYRFSIAWTRVIPDGDGDVNEAGIAFYRRLAEGLRERGIEPYATLYHWDLPSSLQDRGGWKSRDTVDAFTRYAGTMADRLGDLIDEWITQNEPWVASMLGHQTGDFAPGISDWETALTAGHHLLLSHGRAVSEIKTHAPDARVGIALDCRPAYPASDRPEDMAATRHFDGFRNRWFFDPVFDQGYPEDMVSSYVERGRLPDGLDALVRKGDLEVIANPIDFLGLNYYTTIEMSAGREESEEPDVPTGVDAPSGYTEMGWKIDPEGLTKFLNRIQETYEPPSIAITENGASYSDGPDDRGRIEDRRRIDYLSGHIGAVADARRGGVPVDGYFVWSFLDNLEWTQGFSQRFGLVWVDPSTQERIPKESFDWYRRITSLESPEEAEARGFA